MPSILNATTTSGLVTSADNSGSLQLQTNNGTTAVTIDTSQNVSVGTTTVLNSAANRGNITIGGSASSILNLGTGATTQSYLYHIQSGNELYLVNAANGPAIFYTNNTERMRITSGGNALIGTTTDRGRVTAEIDNNSWTYVSNQTGSGTFAHMRFMVAGTAVGSITSSTTTTTYGTSSDYRLKENIAPMQNALGVVSQLKPVTYNWKVDGSAGQGFIAHELQAVVPDCVVGEKDAVDKEGKPVYQGVDTSFLVATLTAAIQELKAELDATKAEVQALKGVA